MTRAVISTFSMSISKRRDTDVVDLAGGKTHPRRHLLTELRDPLRPAFKRRIDRLEVSGEDLHDPHVGFEWASTAFRAAVVAERPDKERRQPQDRRPDRHRHGDEDRRHRGAERRNVLGDDDSGDHDGQEGEHAGAVSAQEEPGDDDRQEEQVQDRELPDVQAVQESAIPSVDRIRSSSSVRSCRAGRMRRRVSRLRGATRPRCHAGRGLNGEGRAV